MPNPLHQLFVFFGLTSLHATGRDAYLIILARSTRMFAYGGASLILALFFSSLGTSDSLIGLFMTLALLGDVTLSLFLTLVADRLGRRRIMVGGAALMVLSGIIFATLENYWILLFAAVVGVVSATGGDVGPFRAIEEAVLSHLTVPRTRADVLSWYVVCSSVGSAVGTSFSGKIVDVLSERDGWTVTRAYHTIFWLYVIMGLVNIAFTLLLSRKVEVAQDEPENVETNEAIEAAEGLLDGAEDGGSNGHVNGSHINGSAKKLPDLPKKKSMFSTISRDTLPMMFRLWFLLGVDSLADGMTSNALTVYYIDGKFHPSKTVLGAIISAGSFLAASSTIFAGPLSRRLGLIRTMVFTHLPSSLAVLLFPIPSSLPMAIVLYFIRTGLNNMDQAPRTAFIAAIVKPDELTAVMGITNILRTLLSASGPTVTGFLAQHDRFWIAFVAAGALRVAYDLGLWAMFVSIKVDDGSDPSEAHPGGSEVRTQSERGDSVELERISSKDSLDSLQEV